MDWFLFVILFIAGIGAGAIVGLIGASAVILMFPILVLVLKMDPYLAIGLSLGTEVIAAIVASRVYYKKKHINLTGIPYFLLFAFMGVIAGSYISLFLPSNGISGLMGIVIIFTGIIFIINKSKNPSNLLDKLKIYFEKRKNLWLSILGVVIGLISGIFGAGGGISILLILFFILGYEMHTAIGTSVIIMLLIAFFGASFHFYYKPFSLIFLLITSIGAIFGAVYASFISNKISERKLKKIAGFILVILGLILATKIFFW